MKSWDLFPDLTSIGSSIEANQKRRNNNSGDTQSTSKSLQPLGCFARYGELPISLSIHDNCLCLLVGLDLKVYSFFQKAEYLNQTF